MFVTRPAQVLALLMLAASGVAQGNAPEQLLIAARAAGGVYAADGILRVAAAVEPSERAALAREALQYAEDAKDPYPLVTYASLDSLEGKLGVAAGLKLDRLSLQLRAVKAVLPLDQDSARALFDQISIGAFPAGCTVPRVYDASEYYEVAAMIVNGMSLQERREEQDLLFAMRLIGAVRSPWQLDGVGRFFRAVRLERAKADALLSVFASQLANAIDTDPNGYTGLLDRVRSLVRILTKLPGAADTLLPAIQAYVRQQGTAPRCATGKGISRAASVQPRLNALLCAKTAPRRCEYGVSERDLQPRTVIVGPPSERLWQSAEAQIAKSRWEALVYTGSAGPRRHERADQDSTGWRDAFFEFLAGIESWRLRPGDAVGPIEKLTLLRRVIPMAPGSSTRLRSIRAYCDALEALERTTSKNQLWFLYAKPLSGYLVALQGADRGWLEIEIDADPVLRLESMLSTSPQGRARRED